MISQALRKHWHQPGRNGLCVKKVRSAVDRSRLCGQPWDGDAHHAYFCPDCDQRKTSLENMERHRKASHAK